MQTKYSKVKQFIKSKIFDGTYVAHQKISSENELMREFDVSRHTIRVAIGELVSEGWLYREQGAGTFCADRQAAIKKENHEQKNIAIITTYISDYIFPSIIRGAESYLSQRGYQVSLYSTNNDIENEKRILETIITQNIDGVIVEPTKSAFSNPNINYYFNFERMNIPYMMINAAYDELEPICLMLDDERGGYIQTEYLIKLGHTNIVGFFKTDDSQGTKRMKGYIKAHRDYQIPIHPANLISYTSEDKIGKPNQELERVLQTNQELPTALVCYNDELAIQLLDVLRKHKIRVPEDLSIIGYDDSFLATVSEVKLTTVAHPKMKMGADAAQMILGLVENRHKRNQTTIESFFYEPELIVRTSTKEI
ncbi:GntR family transcriptional regulator [Alkalihalobacillus pseudalcaliphilus]|uniref:GntR family transcriptional regulator n=1 Tax=Alkalihalobacillus pseudalcaliphilus TaxID=79884 RepID=UPI00064DB7FC|nr:GntR family transcriptional regulator [Alkalihalobacillus pseudalcaliphilus]KMK76597.1 GntR family transcriptional regulator [Alkalihalobacillus pseudalcaliphilus]